LRRIDTFTPTALILDIELPGTDGIEALRMLASRKIKAQILLTSGGDRLVIATTLELGRSRGLAMAGKLWHSSRHGTARTLPAPAASAPKP